MRPQTKFYCHLLVVQLVQICHQLPTHKSNAKNYIKSESNQIENKNSKPDDNGRADLSEIRRRMGPTDDGVSWRGAGSDGKLEAVVMNVTPAGDTRSGTFMAHEIEP